MVSRPSTFSPAHDSTADPAGGREQWAGIQSGVIISFVYFFSSKYENRLMPLNNFTFSLNLHFPEKIYHI